jgi:ABC-type multidrug transport system fused ATPase/permease subunit
VSAKASTTCRPSAPDEFVEALLGILRVIRFDRVSKRYPPGVDALSDLSFEVGEREMVLVGGHSGAGKSTC